MTQKDYKMTRLHHRLAIALMMGMTALLLQVGIPGKVAAQSTATPVVTGYLSSSGCSYGQTTCFVQYGASGGGGTYNGPLATQLPASLGAKAGASSLSVVPDTDTPFPVVGAGAASAAATGNPVGIGCIYNTSPPAYTTGNRTDCQTDSSGNIKFTPYAGSTSLTFSGGVTDAQNNTIVGFANTLVRASLFNGSTWDRQRSIQGVDGTGVGVTAVAASPNSNAASGIVPITTATSTNQLKASAGNAFSVSVTNGTTAGCLILYDSATTPTTGTTLTTANIKFHYLVGASASFYQDFTWPKVFTAGIQLLFSTTCTTYTTPGTLPVLLTGEAK